MEDSLPLQPVGMLAVIAVLFGAVSVAECASAAFEPPAGSVAAAVAVDDDDDDDDDEKPDKREEIQELLDQLLDHIREKGDEDVEAIAVIDQLYQEFPESGPRDRASIVKGLERCFKERRRENEDGTPNNGLYLAAATAFKDMAPESVKPLLGLIGKSQKDDVAVQRRLILSLGVTASDKGIKPLVTLLSDHDAVIQASAAEALGEYEGAEQDVRKDIFKDLLDTIMAVRSTVDTDPDDLITRDRYDVIAGPIITSLQRLSGHDERDPHRWQSWWNNNKKADWDEL